jgi:NAD(P)-dependent dehydrogenase (short-subunit alcohol dehydrogenase family)
MKLKNKMALVTGGGAGLGACITERFVAEGAKVCITGRRRDVLEKMAASQPDGAVVTCAGDVSKPGDVQKMVDTAVVFGGKLDVLVNNAGIELTGAVAELDLNKWQQVIDINLTGPFLLMKAAIPHLIEAGGGSIVNISSTGGMFALPNMPAYGAAKAGLIMLTKNVSLDYGPVKIRSNVVSPGPFRTQMMDDLFGMIGQAVGTDVETVINKVGSVVPLRRVARADEIAGVCVFLASDDSSFMTGSNIVIDGGNSIVDNVGHVLSSLGAPMPKEGIKA